MVANLDDEGGGDVEPAVDVHAETTAGTLFQVFQTHWKLILIILLWLRETSIGVNLDRTNRPCSWDAGEDPGLVSRQSGVDI